MAQYTRHQKLLRTATGKAFLFTLCEYCDMRIVLRENTESSIPTTSGWSIWVILALNCDLHKNIFETLIWSQKVCILKFSFRSLKHTIFL